jgi:pSer/pThr/pTyr-binding forkhead associated (FHA) protein/tetratricopeptide (TPR) repeat protein
MSNEELPLEDERTDSVTVKVAPQYADDQMRELGERLAELYEQRAADPEAQVVDEILRLKYRMRKGPRLWAGEFMQDGRYRMIERSRDRSADGYWKAWDRITGDLVLVRVFHAQWVTDPAAVRAFMSRGDALERLVHPGIGGVLDAARSDEGFVYVATRYFESGNLASARLDTIDALQVAVEVAAALQYAHERGVVHGDLRPGNVMLVEDGGAQVVGFSIEPGAPADGTSLFRAPESTESGYEPQAAADVYALGMVALAALNKGDLPYWVIRDPGRLIRSLPVSEATRAVLAKATDWDLAVRYPSMAAMLEDWLSDPELVESLAVRARERHRYGVAAQHYEALLLLKPTHAVEIRIILGEVYAGTGAWEQAFDHLLLALERTGDVEALFPALRAAAAHVDGWTRLAEALWTQARARDAGRRVILRMELARVNHEHLSNPVAAAETWGQVLADHRTPEQAITALRNLVALAELRQDWVGYTEYCQELLDYAPEEERPSLNHAIGRAYLEHLNEEARGLHFIDRAEATGFADVSLATRMQAIRARRGEWKRVIQLMVQQAASQDLGEASPTLLRAGIIASAVHLEEEAFTVYHALLERAPKHVVALRHVARLHHRAHEHDQAMAYYERLWETYKGRDSEEPEASERAADCTAYASLLVKADRPDEATERLGLALKLNQNHVPSLQLAGPLYLSRGELGQAGVVFDRLLSLFKSVELSSHKIEACLGMGELAWVQGRLTAAMGWYNRAIELDPFSPLGWWGLAKVALSARGGHPGADRAPWVKAVPKRYTGFEALARLIAGLLDLSAMRNWLGLSPLGQALLDGGESGMRSACATVDLLARSQLIDPQLFQRLSDTFPEWHAEIQQVHDLWLANTAATFPVPQSYGWSKRVVEVDFDPAPSVGGPSGSSRAGTVRTVLPPDLLLTTFAAPALATSEAWQVLLGGRKPAAPVAYHPPPEEAVSLSSRYGGPIGALLRDRNLLFALHRDAQEAEIGTGEDAALRILDDPGVVRRHARLYRLGSRVYIESIEDGKILVDGEPRSNWRLVGGERVTLGETRLQFQVFDDPAHLPPTEPEPAPAQMSGGGAGGSDSEERAARSNPPRSSPPRSTPPRPAWSQPNQSGQQRPRNYRSAEPTSLPPLHEAPDRSTNSSESARLLEPTAALRIDGMRDGGDGDEVEEGELTVPLAAMAEHQSGGAEMTVALPSMTGSDVPELEQRVEAGVSAEVYSEHTDPGFIVRSGNSGAQRDDESMDEDDPSEEEVIQGLGAEGRNGRVGPSDDRARVGPSDDRARPSDDRGRVPAMVRIGGEPDPVDGKLIRVMDDGSVDTGPIPEDVLREVLGLPNEDGDTRPLEPMAGPDGRSPGSSTWAAVSDGDDDDDESDGEDGPVDDTTVLMSIPSASDADGVPTLIEASRIESANRVENGHGAEAFREGAPPKGKAGVFAFPSDVQDDDVDKLTPAARVARGVTSHAPAADVKGAPALARAETPTTTPGLPASLEFMSGPERGKRVEVGEELRVGQSRQCELSIPSDGRLSPIHCRVARTPEGFLLTDEGSANGTVVNGQRVTRFSLHGGEVIMVGRTVLRFWLEGAS